MPLEITIDFNTPTCRSIVDLRRIELNTSTTIRTQLTNFIQAKDKITKHNRNLLIIPNLRPYNTPTINQDTNRLLLSIIDPPTSNRLTQITTQLSDQYLIIFYTNGSLTEANTQC